MEEVHDKVDIDLVEQRLTAHQPSPPPSFSPEVEEVLSDEELPDFEPHGYLHEFADEVVESTRPDPRCQAPGGPLGSVSVKPHLLRIWRRTSTPTGRPTPIASVCVQHTLRTCVHCSPLR